nr:hypothetical protein [Lachnospiraceae bacterium]
MINPVDRQSYIDSQTQRPGTAKPVGKGEAFNLDQALNSSDDGGVIYEPSSESAAKKESAAGSGSGAGKDAPRDSYAAFLAEKERAAQEAPGNDIITRILDVIRDFAKQFTDSAKRIFSNFWESKPLNEGAEKAEKPEAFRAEDAEKYGGPYASAEDLGLPGAGGQSAESADGADPYPLPWEVQAQKESAMGTEGAAAAGTDASDVDASRDEAIKAALQAGDEAAFQRLISDYGRRTPARSTSILTKYDASGRIVTPAPSDLN